MNNIDFSKKLERRIRTFGVRIIRLSQTLPNIPESKVIRNQITKSSTSIGANYREANCAKNKTDFKNKVKVCESEATETQYWLEIIVKANWISWEEIKSEYEECCELLTIFSSIGKKL